MTDETLTKLIGAFNAQDFPSFVALRRLSDTVVFGYVWLDEPSGAAANESSCRCYFVLADGVCVGIVYDMDQSDLHWLVLPAHRRNGHLYRALKDVIFPHLFADGRERQRATVKPGHPLEYALRQGFVRIDNPGEQNIRVELAADKVDLGKCPDGENQVFEEAQIQELKQRLRAAKALITSVSEHITCSYGNDRFELDAIAHEVENVALDLSFIE